MILLLTLDSFVYILLELLFHEFCEAYKFKLRGSLFREFLLVW